MSLRYLSVCSGIEAASVAWAPLGWTPAAFAEIDAAAARLLALRFPGVPNLGDLAALAVAVLDPESPVTASLGRVDLLVGGTPCQAFSFAGRRRSLADARGNLALCFAGLVHGLARSAGLRWALWENVPGVLSTADNAFGCLLGALVGGDDPLPLPDGAERWPDAGLVAGPRARAAWRVLDAQYFGLAQRRRRVFVVVGVGDRADPAAVLFEPKSLRRHPPARGETRPGAAGPAAGGAGGGGGDGRMIAHTLRAEGFDSSEDGTGRGAPLVPVAPAVAHVLRAQPNQAHREDQDTLVAYGAARAPVDVAATLSAHGGPHGRQDLESETFVVAALAATLPAGGNATGGAPGTSAETAGSMLVCFDPRQTDVPVHGDRSGPLDASYPGPAIAFDTTQIATPITWRENRGDPRPGDPCHPLAAHAHPTAIAFTCKDHGQDAGPAAPTLRAMAGDHANAGGQIAVAFQGRGGNVALGQDVFGTLTGAGNSAASGAPCLAAPRTTEPAGTPTWAVRRLTPTECERLQGFPDGWTAIPGAADGPRYKQLGNSKPVPVVRWIGARVAAVEAASHDAREGA